MSVENKATDDKTGLSYVPFNLRCLLHDPQQSNMEHAFLLMPPN